MSFPDWPQIGDKYIWEMHSPNRVAGLIVTDITNKGSDWWVVTEGISPSGEPNGTKQHNELSRFQEACLPYHEFLQDNCIIEGTGWFDLEDARNGDKPHPMSITATIEGRTAQIYRDKRGAYWYVAERNGGAILLCNGKWNRQGLASIREFACETCDAAIALIRSSVSNRRDPN